MTETHDYERRREIAQWYDDASGWHREINEATPKAVREAMGKLIRCARQMMLRHADEVLAACAEVKRLRNHIDSAGTGFNVAMGAIRLSLEQADKDRDALRDDLREAMELLRDRQGREVRIFVFRSDDAPAAITRWWTRRDALLAKHEETQK